MEGVPKSVGNPFKSSSHWNEWLKYKFFILFTLSTTSANSCQQLTSCLLETSPLKCSIQWTSSSSIHVVMTLIVALHILYSYSWKTWSTWSLFYMFFMLWTSSSYFWYSWYFHPHHGWLITIICTPSCVRHPLTSVPLAPLNNLFISSHSGFHQETTSWTTSHQT